MQFVKKDLGKTKSGQSEYLPWTKLARGGDQVGTKLLLTSEHLTIFNKCKKPHSIVELMKIAGRLSRTKFRKSINPLLSAGLLEMTEPDSPKSPTQKYRTTKAGREAIKDQKDE